MSAPKLVLVALFTMGSMAICGRALAPTDDRPSPTGNQDLLHALQDLHFDKYLVTPQLEPSHTRFQGWDVYRYRTDELRCVTGGEYFIMARRGADADKTVLWLQGGGACWPGRDDCTNEAQFDRGIAEWGLASPNEDNPVKTWNFIYVPYCDGSIHLGDSEADYDRDGIVDHWHWGFRMTSAAVRLIGELFPDSRRILIAGCSAGGAGTIGATPIVRLRFPEAQLYVFNVSGLGLMNPAGTDLLGVVKDTWNIGDFIPGDCPRCNEQIIYMYSWLLQRDPALRVGLFSSYQDAVSSSGRGMTAEEFESLVIDMTDAIRADHPDTFKRYLVAGDTHCIGDYSYRVNGVSLWDWITYLVDIDPRWTDVLE